MTTSWNDVSTRMNPARRERARSLRRGLTEPEKRLWWHLRHRLPQERTHFRRQVAMGSYVADFCCHSVRLIIEVDGEQHGFNANREHDERRTLYLNAQGYRVLRFSNRDVMGSIDMVLDTIHVALGTATPTPSPSPQGGGERVGGARS